VPPLRAAQARFRDSLRLEREVHPTWSREQPASELITRLPEAIRAMKVDAGNVLATGADAAIPRAKALGVDLGTMLQGCPVKPPTATAGEWRRDTSGIVQSGVV